MSRTQTQTYNDPRHVYDDEDGGRSKSSRDVPASNFKGKGRVLGRHQESLLSDDEILKLPHHTLEDGKMYYKGKEMVLDWAHKDIPNVDRFGNRRVWGLRPKDATELANQATLAHHSPLLTDLLKTPLEDGCTYQDQAEQCQEANASSGNDTR